MTTPVCPSDRPGDAEPCRCLNSWAAVSPTHAGHCCFLPATQKCHPAEFAAWLAGWHARRSPKEAR